VIFGLEYPVMEEAMQTLAYRVTQGERFEGGRAYDGIFEELPCSFLEVHESRFREHFGLANDWYGQHGAKPGASACCRSSGRTKRAFFRGRRASTRTSAACSPTCTSPAKRSYWTGTPTSTRITSR
jgi:hypothetical protein